LGVVLDVVAHRLAHSGDDRHGGAHRRVGARCGQVVEQLTGCGEAHPQRHRLQLSGYGRAIAGLAGRGGHRNVRWMIWAGSMGRFGRSDEGAD
jgi:hypothetical protein